MNEIKKLYEIIGVDESVSDEELERAYSTLREKYRNDRFLEGEAGNTAARKLTELDTAYNVLTDYRKERCSDGSRGRAFENIDKLIKAGKINDAQAALDQFTERNAEWHYLQSVVFYRKNWINESKKQLEISIQMDGTNEKYKNSYDKLCKQINYNASQKGGASKDEEWNHSGSGKRQASQEGSSTYEEPTRMMGEDNICNFCARLMLCNALCNCCSAMCCR